MFLIEHINQSPSTKDFKEEFMEKLIHFIDQGIPMIQKKRFTVKEANKMLLEAKGLTKVICGVKTQATQQCTKVIESFHFLDDFAKAVHTAACTRDKLRREAEVRAKRCNPD